MVTSLASSYLSKDRCLYANASSGRWCVLNKYVERDGSMQLECKIYPVTIGFMEEWVVTEDCVRACRLDKKFVGISSDDMYRRRFMTRLCSQSCYQNFPNVINLYVNLALAEGGFLPEICESERNPKRVMKELRSWREASGPVVAELVGATAPFSDHELHEATYPPVAAPAY